MAKGLFTSMEEIRFYYAYVNGNIESSKGNAQFWDNRDIRLSNRRIAQNVKRLNQMSAKAHVRMR